MKNWYIVQSHSNFENKVAGLIKEEAEKAKISDKIEEIVVPTHDVTEVKRGKRIQRKKKYFPGYVLVKCEMDNDIYHMIKNLKRVSGFLGSKGIPVPVSDKEIEKYGPYNMVKNHTQHIDKLNIYKKEEENPFWSAPVKKEWQLVNKKPIVADKEEQEKNSRSRSAKLRIAEKC